MIRYGVLALGLSYAALWFVNLGGDPFRIAALILMAAGLVLIVCEIVAPTVHPCGCLVEAPALDEDTVDAVEQLQVDKLPADVLRHELVLQGIIRAAGEGPYFDGNGLHVVYPDEQRAASCLCECAEGHTFEPGCELHIAEHRVPPYIDPYTTGPIPLVQPVDLDELDVVVRDEDITGPHRPNLVDTLHDAQLDALRGLQVLTPSAARHRADGT